MDNERIQAALNWAELGFLVFPLRPNTKSEYTDKAETKSKIWYRPGATRHDATQNAAVIRKWWRQTQLANLGVVIPKEQAVVDVDVRNGGIESMAMFAWPETYGEITASGGHHLHYHLPMRINLAPFTIAPGVEILTEGTVFTAAPSSIDTGVYKVSCALPIAGCPEWLVEQLQMRMAPAQTVKPAAGVADVTSYGRVVLEREGLRIEQLPEGQRAVMLNTIVYHLARLIPSGALTAAAIQAEVERATATWKQPSKVTNIVQRAIEAGKLKPR